MKVSARNMTSDFLDAGVVERAGDPALTATLDQGAAQKAPVTHFAAGGYAVIGIKR